MVKIITEVDSSRKGQKTENKTINLNIKDSSPSPWSLFDLFRKRNDPVIKEYKISIKEEEKVREEEAKRNSMLRPSKFDSTVRMSDIRGEPSIKTPLGINPSRLLGSGNKKLKVKAFEISSSEMKQVSDQR